MMTQNNFGWPEIHQQSFQAVFKLAYPDAAELVNERFDLLPTPKELVMAFEATARQVSQRADMRWQEANLMITEINERFRHQPADEARKNALMLHEGARREASNNENVARELTECADALNTPAPSTFARAVYRDTVVDLLKYIWRGEKPDLTEYSRRPSPELTAEDLFRNLPQDARERLEHFRSPSVSTLAPKG